MSDIPAFLQNHIKAAIRLAYQPNRRAGLTAAGTSLTRKKKSDHPTQNALARRESSIENPTKPRRTTQVVCGAIRPNRPLAGRVQRRPASAARKHRSVVSRQSSDLRRSRAAAPLFLNNRVSECPRDDSARVIDVGFLQVQWEVQLHNDFTVVPGGQSGRLQLHSGST